jgi:hypothetical protein
LRQVPTFSVTVNDFQPPNPQKLENPRTSKVHRTTVHWFFPPAPQKLTTESNLLSNTCELPNWAGSSSFGNPHELVSYENTKKPFSLR